MSDGKRKKQKLKLRMSASPDRSPNGSRAVSPEVKAEKPNGAAAGPKAAGPRKLSALSLARAVIDSMC